MKEKGQTSVLVTGVCLVILGALSVGVFQISKDLLVASHGGAPQSLGPLAQEAYALIKGPLCRKNLSHLSFVPGRSFPLPQAPGLEISFEAFLGEGQRRGKGWIGASGPGAIFEVFFELGPMGPGREGPSIDSCLLKRAQ